ncbi:3',5'-cyclic-nucleotide phosphodiesterase PDE2 [Sporobolomyces salmoneus]|uniref:3',5'-cyclic-nucleotide phosphodiesterase PDE2 n=1 Tax=Sporobolomyces salmoneus TaxID=183962 RepID=UPI0031757792
MSQLFTNPFSSTSAPTVALPTVRRTSLSPSTTSTTEVPVASTSTSPHSSPSRGSGPVGGGGGSSSDSDSRTSSVSPFTAAPLNNKRTSVSHHQQQQHNSMSPRRRKSQSESSSSSMRSNSQNRRASTVLPASPRSSTPASPASPMRSPSVSSGTGSTYPFFSGYLAPTTPQPSLSNPNVDFTRRRSVDVGVLGVGTHRIHGITAMSKKVRDAVGPDAGDKETGVIGAGKKGGRDRLLGRHLASLLAHSLALCAEPKVADLVDPEATPEQGGGDTVASVPLEAIPASPTTSPSPTRTASTTFFADSTAPSSATSPISPFECDEALPTTSPSDPLPALTAPPPPPATFPVPASDDRHLLICGLQSWSFNAMSYTSDELLIGVGLIFESVRNMEGVEFDLDRMKSLLMSLRCAYHSRNGYHNFSHAADVTQACYTFLVRMGLAPPLHLLCEDDYDLERGEVRRKWRRNRAVEEGRMGKLLRPMDVFALMVSCIGHDVGHPGLSNAYLVNARAPIAQVYTDKSILENFHNVTLIHMLRKHHFDYLLGGDFGHSGDSATSFRKIVEASILATDMSRHFEFVRELSELGKSFATKDGTRDRDLEADRLLLCAGLIKSADISNPSRPHRISREWSAALLEEWSVQAKIEAEFNLPITVMVQDASDNRALAKGQMGFIDLFCKPLFTAMSSCVDEFHDFSDKLRDGRAAWETMSLQTDIAFSQPAPEAFRLSPAPPSRRSPSPSNLSTTSSVEITPSANTPAPSTKPINLPAEPSFRSRPLPLRAVSQRHGRNASNASIGSSTKSSPLSPIFIGSPSSTMTGVTSFSQLSAALSLNNGRATTDLTGLSSYGGGGRDTFLSTSGGLTNSLLNRGACGGACQATTALCVICAAAQRRGSLPTNTLADSDTSSDEEEDEELDYFEEREDPDLWPPYPFQPTRSLVPPATP